MYFARLTQPISRGGWCALVSILCVREMLRVYFVQSVFIYVPEHCCDEESKRAGVGLSSSILGKSAEAP